MVTRYTHTLVAIILESDRAFGNLLAKVLDPDDGSGTYGEPNVTRDGEQYIAISSPITEGTYQVLQTVLAGVIPDPLRQELDTTLGEQSPADAELLAFVQRNDIELGDRTLDLRSVVADKGYEYILELISLQHAIKEAPN